MGEKGFQLGFIIHDERCHDAFLAMKDWLNFEGAKLVYIGAVACL